MSCLLVALVALPNFLATAKTHPGIAHPTVAHRNIAPRTSHLSACEPPADDANAVPPSPPFSKKATTEFVREFSASEEKVLRQVRREFSGYPAGKYYDLQELDGPAAAYREVRKDHPALKGWSDEELRDTLFDMNSSLSEVLIYSPIGPFLVLSSIAIWRDGLSVWGIPPCRDYLGVCADLANFQFP